MKARTRYTPTSARTREQLIMAAERLFASNGMDNVSLRQINAGAGQRNSSAAHYHFGSKDALIEAISTYRLERIDHARHALFADLTADRAEAEVSIHDLIRVLVCPLVDEIDDSEGGENYILFVAQILGHPTIELRGMWCRQLDTSVGPVYHALRAKLPQLPDEVFASRFSLLWELAIHALADRTRIYGSGRPDEGSPMKSAHLANLMDALHGLLTAPVSAATSTAVDGVREQVPAG